MSEHHNAEGGSPAASGGLSASRAQRPESPEQHSVGQGIRVTGLHKRYADTVVLDDLDLDVAGGEFLVVVGPSGCGKSTLLRIVAGIEPLSHGTVLIGGRDVTYAHPADRGISMVFQDYALYPHLTVAGNLSFGLRAHHVPKQEIRRRIKATSQILGIEQLLGQKPAQLSGGQRQRVALGRAMIREPRAYLMDEPLSNLDAALRVQMRAELIEFHQRVAGTVLYVTHDQIEAMTMGHRVAVMNAGRFEQIDSPQRVYDAPASLFVAGFLGSPRMNLLEARVSPGADGSPRLTAGALSWTLPEPAIGVRLPDRVVVGFRPEAVTCQHAGNDRADVFTATTALRENLGNEVIAHLDVGELRIISRLAPRDAVPGGHPAGYRVDLADLHLFQPDGPALWHGSALRDADPAAAGRTRRPYPGSHAATARSP